MTFIPVRAAVCLMVAAFATALSAQNIDSLFQQFNRQHDAGHYTQSEQLARQMLATSTTPGWRAASLNCLGRALMNQDRLPEAESQLKQAAQIQLQPTNVNNGWIPANLGIVYRKQQKYAEAERWLQSALAFFQRRNPNSSEVASVLTSFGSLEVARDRFDKALEYHQRALAMRESIFGAGSEQVGYSQQHVANDLRNLKRYAESGDYFKRAIATLEKNLGPDHNELAIALNSSGFLYRATSDFAKAETADRRALAIREKHFAPNNEDVLSSLEHLQEDLKSQGRTADADELQASIAAAKAWKPRVEITATTASVKDGSATVATVKRGDRFDVIQTSGDLLAIAFNAGKGNKTGWIKSSDARVVNNPADSSSLAATPIVWRDFTPPGTKCSVVLPGSPRHDVQTASGVEADAYTVDCEEGTFRVGFFNIPAGIAFNKEAGAAAIAAARKGKIVSKKDIEVDFNPAYEVDIELPDGKLFRTRSLRVSRKYYELSLQASPAVVKGEIGNKFFGSFKLQD